MRRYLTFGLLVCLASCRPERAAKPGVTVGAAANLTGVFERIGPRFEAQTGIHPVFSFASTAQLARQIENSAPFDVFTAADREHMDQLDHKGLLAPGSRAIYARGVLALWIPPGSKSTATRIEDLEAPEVRFIAVAKPDLAPYGQAAVDTLKHAGIWEKVKQKIVYAENIRMAKQYGASNNTDAVFTAYSLVIGEGGRIIRVDPALHQPLDQELGIVANAKNPEGARKFAAFLLAGEGRDILGRSGYDTPKR
jgi:molybdate transport system substrate-binding protein